MAIANTHSSELQPSPRTVRYEPSPKRVLLVVEEEALRAEILEALAIDRHHVVLLEDSWELWDYFQATSRPNPMPDAIITALGLPGPGSLEIVAALGERMRLPPVIGLASFGDSKLYAEAKRLGLAYVFEMPIDPDDLRDVLFSTPGGCFAEVAGARQQRLGALDRGTHWLARLS